MTSRAAAPRQPPAKTLPVSTTTALDSESARIPTPPLSRIQSPPHRRSRSNIPADKSSDEATAAFIRRTLCNQQARGNAEREGATPKPLDELLPPLTSSNAVDLQLYALLAIIIREFVYSWYAKITPDHVFVEEVVQLFAHCTRAIEQRVRKVDLESLLLDEIPALLEAHIVGEFLLLMPSAFDKLTAYRTSHVPWRSSPPLNDPRHIYHALHPHPALDPVPVEGDEKLEAEQQDNEAMFRQLLVQGTLALLLPTEDLESGCLRTLVADVLAELILGNGIAGKVSQRWMIWEAITKGIESWKGRIPECDKPTITPKVPRSRLERFGLVPGPDVKSASSPVRPSLLDSFSTLFRAGLRYCYIAFVTVRSIILALVSASSLPPRSAWVSIGGGSGSNDKDRQASGASSSAVADQVRLKQPIMAMKIWSCICALLELDTRMPWLYGFVTLLQWGAIAGPGSVGGTNGPIDKLLSHAVHTRLLNSSHLAPLLLTLRKALFPGNTLAPARPIPSEAEIDDIKARCVRAILYVAPKSVWARYFNTDDQREQQRQIEEVLDVFSDSYCNKHLLYGIVELLFVRLMPELADKGPSELLAMRLD